MVVLSFFIIVAHRNMISFYNMSKPQEGYTWSDTLKVSGDRNNHIRDIMIKKKARDNRVRYVDPLKLQVPRRRTTENVVAESKSSVKNGKQGKSKQSVSMLDKFEIACLVGTNTIFYVSLREDGDLYTFNH